MRLSGIFDHFQAEPVGYSFNCLHVERLAVKVYTGNNFCPFGNAALNLCRVDFPGIRVAIDKNRRCAYVRSSPRRSNKRIGGNDYLIARTNAERQHGQLQRRGTVVNAHGILCAAIVRKMLLEGIDIRATRKRIRLEHLFGYFQHLVLDLRILLFQIEAGNFSYG